VKYPIHNWWEFVGLTLGALLTLGVYSFLYRENKISRICEHIFLGVSGALAIVVTWEQTLLPKWWQPMYRGFAELGGHNVVGSIGPIVAGLLAVMLGACWYFIFSRKYMWLARLVMGVVIGATAGLSFKLIFEAQMPQITESARRSLYAVKPDPAGIAHFNAVATINNIVFIAILLSVMVYFFFSFEQKHIGIRGVSKFGRWCLMITFGTYFGNTVMARMSLFIERFQFLTEKWAMPAMHWLIHH
jgi:MFS family permease